ncbi:DoxX family protein [Flavobacteriaceae bacterium]|jgi:uncharacterized membrane protein YphA (DoxX/SURF4 family)|nr:DoxX family protein [Flavobacteriaceae bacterium]|tara:strand:- start:558 stop:905 length:348 start_codon:yes stop_codon:yes gene_type:complete
MDLSNFEYLKLFSSFSFLSYGILSFTSNKMKSEFSRWGISKFRVIVGISQIAGGLGLIFGFLYPLLSLVAAMGLSLLMFLGFVLRLKVRDGALKSSPALVYFILNIIIVHNEITY